MYWLVEASAHLSELELINFNLKLFEKDLGTWKQKMYSSSSPGLISILELGHVLFPISSISYDEEIS